MVIAVSSKFRGRGFTFDRLEILFLNNYISPVMPFSLTPVFGLPAGIKGSSNVILQCKLILTNFSLFGLNLVPKITFFKSGSFYFCFMSSTQGPSYSKKALVIDLLGYKQLINPRFTLLFPNPLSCLYLPHVG